MNTRQTNQTRLLDRRTFVTGAGVATGLSLRQRPGRTPGEPEPAPEPRIDPQAPLRVGLIGREGHLSLVFEALDSLPDVRIAAVAFEDDSWEYNCDGTRRGRAYDLEPGRQWVESHPWSASSPRLYETYQSMLENETLEVAVVCLPYQRNAGAIAACARAGVHVLTEKPVAVNVNDLEMVERALAEHPIRLSAMFALRYAPSFYTIRRMIESGALGTPCLGSAQKSYQFGHDRPWFYRSREIYGSTILWVGIHAIDYLRWTMGLEVTQVSGFHRNLTHPEFPGLQDSAVVCLRLEGGASAALTMDFLRPESAPSHGDDRLRIACARGVVDKNGFEDQVNRILPESGSGSVPLIEAPRGLFADFVGELRGQHSHLIGPREVLQVTRICIAATIAADEQRVIPVA